MAGTGRREGKKHTAICQFCAVCCCKMEGRGGGCCRSVLCVGPRLLRLWVGARGAREGVAAVGRDSRPKVTDRGESNNCYASGERSKMHPRGRRCLELAGRSPNWLASCSCCPPESVGRPRGWRRDPRLGRWPVGCRGTPQSGCPLRRSGHGAAASASAFPFGSGWSRGLRPRTLLGRSLPNPINHHARNEAAGAQAELARVGWTSKVKGSTDSDTYPVAWPSL